MTKDMVKKEEFEIIDPETAFWQDELAESKKMLEATKLNVKRLEAMIEMSEIKLKGLKGGIKK